MNEQEKKALAALTGSERIKLEFDAANPVTGIIDGVDMAKQTVTLYLGTRTVAPGPFSTTGTFEKITKTYPFSQIKTWEQLPGPELYLPPESIDFDHFRPDPESLKPIALSEEELKALWNPPSS